MSDTIYQPPSIDIKFWCNTCDCHRYIRLFLELSDGVWKHDATCPMCFVSKKIAFIIRNGKQV